MEYLQTLWNNFYEASAAVGSFTLFLFLSLLLLLLFLVSIAGCLLPVLPGPVLAFFTVILWKLLLAYDRMSWLTIFICALITLLAQVLDYYLPVKYTPTKAGSRGAFTGVIVGFVLSVAFPPFAIFAIFLSPLVFAFLFEYISDSNFKSAFKSGKGAFIGTILTVFAKAFAILLMILVALFDIAIG